MTKIEVASDKLAAVVTYFEMTRRPTGSDHQSLLTFPAWEQPDLNEYRALFQNVGNEWLWFGQLMKTDEELQSTLHADKTKIFKIRDGQDVVGFVELDFSDTNQCEIVYFGLVPEMNGKGFGHAVMAETLKRAWKPDIKRVWLHTCTSDSPRAGSFYERSGFKAYKREIEIHPDPRLTGHLPMDAGPHIPIIPAIS